MTQHSRRPVSATLRRLSAPSFFSRLKAKMMVTVLALALSAPAAWAQTGVQLYGTVFDAWGSSEAFEANGKGLYTLNTANPSAVTLVKAGLNSYGGGTYAQGIYYSSFYSEDESGRYVTMPVKLSLYNATTWAVDTVYRGFAFSSIASDLTFDPVTQRIYGCFYDDDYNQCQTLGRIHVGPANADWGMLFSRDSIGRLPERMVAITANIEGQLYGISVSGKLYAIDKYTAATRLVGETGVDPIPVKQSATCSYANGKIYWAAVCNDSEGYVQTSIYEVDTTTGAAKVAADLSKSGEQFLGLYIKQDPTLAKLPQRVTNLTASAASTTQGRVTFTLPTQDVDNNALNGQLAYAVRLNGNVVAEGQGAPGAAMEATFTAPNEGVATVLVTAAVPATGSQPAAVGEPETASVWIGHGVPTTPSALTIADNGTEVALSWTAPEGCVSGGMLDKEHLWYSVTRYTAGTKADSTVVADSITTTTYTDTTLPAVTATYYYKVVAHNGSFASAPAVSDSISRTGGLALPYTNALDSEGSLAGFTIIDVNDDGATWHYDSDNSAVVYVYNSKNAADDWLITPGINMQRGAVYTFTFEAMNTYPEERLEAKIGTAPTAAAMTETVVEPTVITYQPRVHTIKGTFRATADGMCYFGIHAISDADKNTLYVRNLTISETPLVAPAAVDSFTVTPGDKGANTAAIAFNAPKTNLDGSAIEGDLSVRIVRNDVVLDTLENITPGQRCSFTDEGTPSGQWTYSATVIDANGNESATAEQTVYVGLDTPGPVEGLRAVEDLDNEGLIHVTWNSPQKGIHGGYIDPAGLSYYISSGYESEYRDLGNATSFDDRIAVNGRQTYTGYTVYAANNNGSDRESRRTCTAIAGPANPAPMVESFPNCTLKSGPWLTNVTNGEIGEAYCYGMTEYETVKAQDDDNGMQSFSAIATGKSVRSESPKVDIRTLQKPQLTFWAQFNGAADSLIVSVSPDYKGFQPVLRLCADKVEKGWQRYTVDLSAFSNSRFVQIGFEGKCMSELNNFIDYDNVAVIEKAEYDLMAMTLSAPERTTTGKAVNLQLTLRNNSADPVVEGTYSVQLLKNGKKVASKLGTGLNGDRVVTLTLTDTPSVFDPDTTDYRAIVEMEDDEVAANDSSTVAKVIVDKPDYPVPTALTAGKNGTDVSLNWTAPDLINRHAKATTDNFDGYKAFDITGYGQWTTVDRDGQNTIRITLNAAFGPLQYNNAGKPMAFQVFNVTDAGIPLASWSPHSGEQMLVSFANASPDQGYSQGKQNDDWLISPRLDGSAQTIRFYAKAGMGGTYLPERMQTLFSTTDTATASFTQVGQTIDVTNVSGWQEFRFDVPEGARYFAIRCVSDYKFALLIDDITYIAEGSTPEPLVLQGYNVYREGELLNDGSLATATSFLTPFVADDTRYQVTAVYDKGESMPSEVATVTGITDVKTDAAATAAKGGIIVSGQVPATIWTVDGKCAAQGTGFIRLQSGVYVVKTNGKVNKVMVR